MATTPPNRAFDQVLARAGLTGQLMRKLDAATCPLGSPDQWPEALRATMRVYLSSAFPFILFWGPEYVLLYNDAAIPMMAGLHPRALGQAREAAAPETFGRVKPLLEQVTKTGEPLVFENALYAMDRADGKQIEAYFSFGFSAVRDENDAICGVLNITIPTTAKVLNDRRLGTLQSLSAGSQHVRTLEEVFTTAKAAFEANPKDLQLTRIYKFSADRSEATLVLATGALDAPALTPATIRLADASAIFPLARLAASPVAEQISGLSRLGAAIPDSAVLLPLIHRGEQHASAVLVVGYGPPLDADAKHREFLESIAKSIAIAASNALSMQELATAHREVEAQRERLLAVLNQMPLAVAIAEVPSGKIVMANTQIERLFRRPVRPAESLAGYGVTKVFRLDGTPFPDSELPIARAVLHGTSTRHEMMVLDRGDGDLVTLEVNAGPVRDATGKITAAVTVFDDVSDRIAKDKERALLLQSEAAARTRAEEADRRKDEFLAMLSHELRNPLAALSTALEVADKLERSPDVARLHATSRRQVVNLVRLVDDLLDVSRITHGRVELQKSDITLDTLLQAALDSNAAAISARQHQLTTHIQPGPYPMHADSTRLQQVIGNLLVNAAKYTEPGGKIDVSLTHEDSPDGPFAKIVVKDSGVGIARPMLNQVFELFVQGDAPLHRSSGGLGIGLTLVKKLVELHDGTATAHSDGPGKGSTFTVQLPLRSAPVAAATAAPVARAPGSRRVVVIEDNEDLRLTLEELLIEFGHEVHSAGDGLSGVDKVLSVRPDVALIDVGLPGVDGYEVARRVRAAPHGKELYLVALTGYGGATAKAKAIEAGFNLHMVKPLMANDLIKLMQAVPAPLPQ